MNYMGFGMHSFKNSQQPRQAFARKIRMQNISLSRTSRMGDGKNIVPGEFSEAIQVKRIQNRIQENDITSGIVVFSLMLVSVLWVCI